MSRSARFASAAYSAAINRLTATLESDQIPYAIVGAMALNAHGYRRVTVDVDVLLTRDGLARFKEKHLGRGWDERFPGMFCINDGTVNTAELSGPGLGF